MRFTLVSLVIALFAAISMAAIDPAFYDLIVTAKDQQSLEKAKEKIKETEGAQITHEYTIIPAMAVKMPASTVQALQAMDDGFEFERDGIVTTQSGKDELSELGI